jgi:hypothetical protein
VDSSYVGLLQHIIALDTNAIISKMALKTILTDLPLMKGPRDILLEGTSFMAFRTMASHHLLETYQY